MNRILAAGVIAAVTAVCSFDVAVMVVDRETPISYRDTDAVTPAVKHRGTIEL